MYIFLVCALYVYVHTSESYSIKPGVRVSHCHTVSSGYAGTSSWIHPQGCHQGPSGKGDCPVPFCGRPHSTPPPSVPVPDRSPCCAASAALAVGLAAREDRCSLRHTVTVVLQLSALIIVYKYCVFTRNPSALILRGWVPRLGPDFVPHPTHLCLFCCAADIVFCDYSTEPARDGTVESLQARLAAANTTACGSQ